MSDKSNRKLLSTIVLSLMALSAYLLTVPGLPDYVGLIATGVAIVLQVVKDEYVSKEVKNKVQGQLGA